MNIMNTYKKNLLIISLTICLIFGIGACHDRLDIIPMSQFAPDNFLRTEQGITALLHSAYEYIQFNSWDGANKIYVSEWPTDILLQSGGGMNNQAVLYINYTWDSQHGWLNGHYNKCYQGIRDTNALIDNVDNVDTDDNTKSLLKAEARFIRAVAYTFLYDWFGPTPLVISSTIEEINPERATDEEMINFIENELQQVAELLPVDRPADEYGRGTRGAALSFLTKFLLNTKQWEKCAVVAQQVMDLGKYSLFPEYTELFKVENEINDEFIFVHPAINQPGNGNVLAPAAFPPDYPTPGTHENWAAQVRVYDDFYLSFEEDDERKNLIITEYIDVNGEHRQLLGEDNSRSFKYWPDPNANGRWTGNDIPEIRYADILLSRAEALSRMNGPNQESIDLINEVRVRAGLSEIELTDFPDAGSLNSHILKERGWEFYNEAKRREDMIRHEVLISNAQERGKNARQHHLLFPIPQSEMDTNPNLIQNEGY